MKRALTIAGSDPSGGAGIQADIKTMSANGVYAMSVITSLTAQNTTCVSDIYNIPSDFVVKQMKSVFEDIIPDAVKIGMIGDAETACAVADMLAYYNIKNIVIDPVMISTAGSTLTDDIAVKALCRDLLPKADVITPNISEAEILTGSPISSYAEMLAAARILYNAFGCSVLIKGGHADFDDPDHRYNATDLLLTDPENPVYYYADRINNPNTHGTGCTLSSAIASNLAKGSDLHSAVRNAKIFTTGAIVDGMNIGRGRGPLNHIYMNFPTKGGNDA